MKTKFSYLRLTGSSNDRRKAFRSMKREFAGAALYRPKGSKVLSGVKY
jgi:hypothetical protein